MTLTSLPDRNCIHLEKIIDPDRYGTMNKLHRVTAQILRFIKKLRKQLYLVTSELRYSKLRDYGSEVFSQPRFLTSYNVFEPVVKMYEFNNLVCFSMMIRLFGVKVELPTLRYLIVQNSRFCCLLSIPFRN